MLVVTSAGYVLGELLPEEPETVLVSSVSRASMKVMLDGIELMGTAEDGVDGQSEPLPVMRHTGDRWVCRMSKGTFALWVQFEILNFLDYEDFGSRLTVLQAVEDVLLGEILSGGSEHDV